MFVHRALYNCKLKKISASSCQRRIHYDLIESISVSSITEEFIIHIPQEYDYRFKSYHKHLITTKLKQLCNQVRPRGEDGEPERKVIIHKIKWDDMGIITCTKEQARKVSADERRERLNTYHSLMEEEDFLTASSETVMARTDVTDDSADMKKNITRHSSHEKQLPSMTSLHEEIFQHLCIESQELHVTQPSYIAYIRSNSRISNNGHTFGDDRLFDKLYENSIQFISNDDNLLVNGYCYQLLQEIIDTTETVFATETQSMYSEDLSLVIDYCLLYLSAIDDVFDSVTEDIWSDTIEISDDNKTITINDEYIGRTIYGSYVIDCNNNNMNNRQIFGCNLRVNHMFDEHGIVGSLFIGIDSTDDQHAVYTQCFSRCHNSYNYSFGGSKLMGYNLWRKDRVNHNDYDENEPELENGDYVYMELDLRRATLMYIINCEHEYKIKNINTKNSIKYRLAVYLSNVSITIKDFKVYNERSGADHELSVIA